MTVTNARFFHLSPISPALGRLQEAERFFLAGNLNEALAAAQQAWREQPQEPDVFRVLAYIHMARGEYPPAAQAAYQAVLNDGDNPASYASFSQVYLTFGMLHHAEETIMLARQRFPDDSTLLVLAADLRFRQGRIREAVQLARQALAANADDYYAKALIGTSCLRNRQYREAVDLLAAAVQAYPQRWDYLRDYGIALLNLGQYADARQALAQGFRLNSADPGLQQHFHYALRFTGSAAPGLWAISFFFYNFAWLGWLLFLLGIISMVIGISLGVIRLPNPDSWNWLPLLLLTGGLALICCTISGITLRQRRGEKFERALRKAVDAGAQLSPAG